MNILSNTDRSDRALKSQLRILKKTLRVKGSECLIIRNKNKKYSRVFGHQNIDVDGDNFIDTVTIPVKLVINNNFLDHYGDKGQNQTVYHFSDDLNEGDIISYSTKDYEYRWRVAKKNYYGETNRLYEYELEPLELVAK